MIICNVDKNVEQQFSVLYILWSLVAILTTYPAGNTTVLSFWTSGLENYNYCKHLSQIDACLNWCYILIEFIGYHGYRGISAM